MKKSLVALVIAFAVNAVGQAGAAPQSQPAAAAPQAAPAQQKKEIKDPAEYNAYVGAVQQTDPNAKISGLEAFLSQYPNSVMKVDALELLMGAYQQSNNQAKMMDASTRLLAADPNNLRALALLAYTGRTRAEANQDPQKSLAEGAQYSERGLNALKTATKPDGMSEADFDKMKNQMANIFQGVAGIAALQNKDNAGAQMHLRAAVQIEPNDLRNVYPLALSYLTATPPDYVNGLFFIARAANLAAGSPGQAQIQAYGKSQYTKYHGSDQGWADLLTTTKSTTLPPDGFTIAAYVPPTPAEQCAEIVAKGSPKQMSFAEWELCLSAGKPEDAEKVWAAIKGVALVMEGNLITGTPTKLEIAASSDDIDAKRADVVLEMSGTIPPKLMPKEGGVVDFQGIPTSYQATPFVMMMDNGALVTKAPPAPAKKPPVRRKPVAK